ncbi:hypothetical protein Ahy_B01g053965 [Arachis hypogaea]|uniref:Aminotransferase-like plant mobile domain-containing protein n=1 Tax=Arachis hypogaea TaxID=3818 RepID=A0A445AT01_ARAHY|nr:hypothetical protein Ahy_B01g053965 [Arachis hypogaea]
MSSKEAHSSYVIWGMYNQVVELHGEIILSNLCLKGSLHRFDLGVIWSFGELPLDKEIWDSPTDTNENTVKIYALAYIMMHLSTQMFINKLGTRVHIRWLPYVTNLENLRKYSWSFAILAWLYCDTVACVAFLHSLHICVAQSQAIKSLTIRSLILSQLLFLPSMASLNSVTVDVCLPPPIAPLSPIVLRPCHHVPLLPSPMASRPCPR